MARKDEWRRKKKAKAALAPPVSKVTVNVDEALEGNLDKFTDQLKAGYSDARRRIADPVERAEFTRLVEEETYRIQDNLDKFAPNQDISIDYQKLARLAKNNVGMAKFQFKGGQDLSEEDLTVESYLMAVNTTLKVARFDENPQQRANGHEMYALFQEARVFHMGGETYVEAHKAADEYVSNLSGVYYRSNSEPSDQDVKTYQVTLTRSAKEQFLPDQLPFPVMFLGYGSGPALMLDTARHRLPKPLQAIANTIRILAHLVTKDECFAVLQVEAADEEADVFLSFETVRHGQQWVRGMELEPWILPPLVKTINSHRTFIQELELSGNSRRTIKENKHVLGVDNYKYTPRPYYKLHMDSKVIQEKVRRNLGGSHASPTYRTDVRGHERCRIARGPLPIDPKVEEKLHKKGYKVFKEAPLDPDTLRLLNERHISFKKPDEWMAIKASWVREHMTSNNPKLPYIPAVRVPKPGTARRVSNSWVDNSASG